MSTVFRHTNLITNSCQHFIDKFTCNGKRRSGCKTGEIAPEYSDGGLLYKKCVILKRFNSSWIDEVLFPVKPGIRDFRRVSISLFVNKGAIPLFPMGKSQCQWRHLLLACFRRSNLRDIYWQDNKNKNGVHTLTATISETEYEGANHLKRMDLNTINSPTILPTKSLPSAEPNQK